MSASIARFLKDFGEPEAPAMPSVDPFDLGANSFGDFGVDAFPEVVTEPPLDIEALKAAAFEEGKAQALAELTAKFDAEKLELISQHSEDLSKLRDEFMSELGQKLGAQMVEAMDNIALLLAEQSLSAMTPVLTEELSKRASEELAQLVKEQLLDADCTKLSLKGPKPMYDALLSALGEIPLPIQFTETDDADLTVEIGESVVVTRMSAWASSLRKVMQ